ncbi:MAG: MaoC/PaaZ C-terminal domain-containing protein [Rhodoblastus sp.]
MTGPLARGDRMPEAPVGPFDAAAVAAYAAASGDDNPLHLDPALAARAGFAAPPVHGMRLMAEIAPSLARWRPDMALKRLSGTFVEPLLVGETATLSGRVMRADAEILVRVTIQGPRRGPSLLAEAILVPREAA